ncbi:hypothetical protein BSKO_09396 [Bryopsis sp. KO-2023]|nr:hypothetical protein BSKO_09396 [Bryopsis sp. KO-2023]
MRTSKYRWGRRTNNGYEENGEIGLSPFVDDKYRGKGKLGAWFRALVGNSSRSRKRRGFGRAFWRKKIMGVWLLTLIAVVLVTWRGVHTRSQLGGLRSCRVSWECIKDHSSSTDRNIRIGIVTLAGSRSNAAQQGQRDFGGVIELTWENKESYARLHNYEYINASDLLDRERPPAWSKILAVRHFLSQYDWILWLDSDTVIMNHETELETLLPMSGFMGPDLILTEDAGGANAGVWFLKNSAWSVGFLEKWWSMDSYIRKAGDTKSGDNDAMKALLREMDRAEYSNHVRIAPQCAFNSYIWKGSGRNWLRFLRDPRTVETGLYKDGDFILHLAGVDNKSLYIRNLLKNAS